MAWNTPISLARVLDLLEQIELQPDDVVVDVGCGTGEFLDALQVLGHGYDLEDASIVAATKLAPRHVFQTANVNAVVLPACRLAVCLGSTHAYADGPDALPACASALHTTVESNGFAMFGMGYQKRALPDEYAAMLGEFTGIERSHGENVVALEKHGWDVIDARTATEDEWDAFEWAFYRRKGNREWRNAYHRWGRDVMGFGVYLARRQPKPLE